jgi:hypothetical protein
MLETFLSCADAVEITGGRLMHAGRHKVSAVCVYGWQAEEVKEAQHTWREAVDRILELARGGWLVVGRLCPRDGSGARSIACFSGGPSFSVPCAELR